MILVYFLGGMFALSIMFSIIRWTVQKLTMAITDAKRLKLLEKLEPQLYELEAKSIDKHFLKLTSDADALFRHLEVKYALPEREPERTVDYYIQAERRHLRHRR
jgi:hypothetical protein